MRDDDLVVFTYLKCRIDSIKSTIFLMSCICGIMAFICLLQGHIKINNKGIFYVIDGLNLSNNFYILVFFSVSVLLSIVNCFIPTKSDLEQIIREIKDK